jgi:hypothetical protein
MRILAVYCHPLAGSYCAALRDRALQALRDGGHEVELLDLYAEGFDPVLSPQERSTYLADTAANLTAVQRHVDLLRWAEGLLFVFPTWFYGPPAMLKGVARTHLASRRGFPGARPQGRTRWSSGLAEHPVAGLHHDVRRALVVAGHDGRPRPPPFHARTAGAFRATLPHALAAAFQHEQRDRG